MGIDKVTCVHPRLSMALIDIIWVWSTCFWSYLSVHSHYLTIGAMCRPHFFDLFVYLDEIRLDAVHIEPIIILGID